MVGATVAAVERSGPLWIDHESPLLSVKSKENQSHPQNKVSCFQFLPHIKEKNRLR